MSHDSYIQSFPLNTLKNNPSILNSAKYYYPLIRDYHYQFIGSCHGLFCFVLTYFNIRGPQNTWFKLWNPTTRTLSKKFGHHICNYLKIYWFSFGYDNSTGTYMVVYFRPNMLEIFSFVRNDHKIIQLPHTVPLKYSDLVPYKHKFLRDAVYSNGTIISLNLGTDTYSMLLPPQDFVEVSFHLPTIHVFEDSLF